MLHLAFFASLFCLSDGKPAVPDDALQLVVGLAPNWRSPVADVYRFERKSGEPWKRVGGPRRSRTTWRANTGKNGLAAGRGLIDWCGPESERKIEGDKKAPAGIFRIGRAYGFGAGKKLRKKLLPLTDDMVCVSDPTSRHYNEIVDESETECDWDWARPLKKPDGVMRRMVMIGVNGADPDPARPIANAGSCILFHISRGPKRPTVGCTSLPREAMDRFIAWLDPAKKPVYLLMTRRQYRELARRKGLGLPPVP